MPKGKNLFDYQTEERRCTARSKQSDRQCKHWVVSARDGDLVLYGTVCHWHGGGKQVKRLEREIQELKLKSTAQKLGASLEIEPSQALLQQVWEAAGNVAFYRERIAQLEDPMDEDLDPVPPFPELTGEIRDESGAEVDGATAILLAAQGNGRPQLYSPNHLGNLEPHVLVRMYNEERDRLVKVAKAAIECNLGERNVRIAEQQGRVVVNIILTVAQDPRLALTEQQQVMVRQLAAAQLRELTEASRDDVEDGEWVDA